MGVGGAAAPTQLSKVHGPQGPDGTGSVTHLAGISLAGGFECGLETQPGFKSQLCHFLSHVASCNLS